MIKNTIVLVLVLGLSLIFAALWMGFVPGSELNEVARYYADNTAREVGAQNIVTAIIVTYRGLDTLGEVTVLFLTAAIVGLVLARARALERAAYTRPQELPPAGELLEIGARLLVPLILLFGAYVFINGHLTPGGGFQGGAIVASAVLLMLLTDPLRRFSRRLITLVESTMGLVYVAIGVIGLALAGGFLDNRILPLGEFGSLFSAGAIPVIYSLIGLKVGAEFSAMMVSLSETEDR